MSKSFEECISAVRAVLAVVLASVLTLVCGCASPAGRHADAPLHFDPPELPAPDPAGPTLRLNVSGNDATTIPIADFMYLIPLISPEPISMVASAGNTQRVRITEARRRVSAESFSLESQLDIFGGGSVRSTIHHEPNIQRNPQKLRDSGVIERVLDSITIDGPGAGSIEVEGAITNGLATVTEVRLRFNTGGRVSPVNIGVADLRVTNGVPSTSNEHLARVTSLTFQRDPGSFRMGVTISSVRRKDGREGFWSKLAALAANIVLKPIKVDPAGHEAMLNLGRQLAAEASSFTFPRAKNLKAAPAGAPPDPRVIFLNHE